MPAVRKISLQQQRILADFMASNLDFAHNRTVGESGAGGRESSARLWQELTAILNAEEAGVTKTVDEWKKYWKRFKYEVKAKAAALRRSAARAGGGPCTLPPLTDVEEIVVGIIGEHAITGYSQVRIDNVAVDSPAIAGPSSQPPFLQSACRNYAMKMAECMRKRNPDSPNIGRIPIDRLLYPHMVLIGYGVASNKNFKCGGSLIHESWVLTAAHCLQDPDSGPAQRMRIGTATFEFDESEDLIQDRNILLRVKHPDYMPPSKYNDIALLKADNPFKLSRDIRIACLPNSLASEPHSNLTVIGFGTTESDSRKGSHTLMRVDVDLIDSQDCNKTMASLIKMGTLENGITDGQFCAGDLERGGRDTCQGDSGGPLQYIPKNPDCINTFPLPVVIGVTSFGRHCGFKFSPGVYTSVYHYVDWIEEVVWPTGQLRLVQIPSLSHRVNKKDGRIEAPPEFTTESSANYGVVADNDRNVANNDVDVVNNDVDVVNNDKDVANVGGETPRINRRYGNVASGKPYDRDSTIEYLKNKSNDTGLKGRNSSNYENNSVLSREKAIAMLKNKFNQG